MSSSGPMQGFNENHEKLYLRNVDGQLVFETKEQAKGGLFGGLRFLWHRNEYKLDVNLQALKEKVDANGADIATYDRFLAKVADNKYRPRWYHITKEQKNTLDIKKEAFKAVYLLHQRTADVAGRQFAPKAVAPPTAKPAAFHVAPLQIPEGAQVPIRTIKERSTNVQKGCSALLAQLPPYDRQTKAEKAFYDVVSIIMMKSSQESLVEGDLVKLEQQLADAQKVWGERDLPEGFIKKSDGLTQRYEAIHAKLLQLANLPQLQQPSEELEKKF
ncbi:MAG TPA: hypothetical protein VN457_07295, partial [Chlamydiales bacterium]|nr:hypothetical protein [Chlamydiales bacterium]